jgi:hypothetical protein
MLFSPLPVETYFDQVLLLLINIHDAISLHRLIFKLSLNHLSSKFHLCIHFVKALRPAYSCSCSSRFLIFCSALSLVCCTASSISPYDILRLDISIERFMQYLLYLSFMPSFFRQTVIISLRLSFSRYGLNCRLFNPYKSNPIFT